MKESLTTQERILAAAAKVFSEKGFKNATTRMICKEAGVNVALVNYYFRSKAELYKEVVVSLFENISAPLKEISKNVKDEASWRAAIRTFVRWGLGICAAVKPPELYISRLMGLEASVPSEMEKKIQEQLGLPMRKSFDELMKMGIRDATDVQLNLWFSAIHAQCVVYALEGANWMKRYCPPGLSASVWLDNVCDHICETIFTCLRYQG